MQLTFTQWLAMGCVLGSIPAVALALRDVRLAPPPWRRAILWVTCLGLILRWLIPGRWVMFYTGYELVDAASLFGQSTDGMGISTALFSRQSGVLAEKYGQATFALHHLAQQFHLPPLPTWIGVNRIYGGLLAPLAAILLGRTGGSWRAATLAAVAIATLPLLVRDAASESQLVPVTVWLVAGGSLWARLWLSDGFGKQAWSAAAATLVLFGSALHGRPEALILVPLTLVLVSWLAQRSGAAHQRPSWWRGRPAIMTAAIGLLCLSASRLAELLGALDVQAGLGNTPKLFEVDLSTLLLTIAQDGLFRKSLLFRPNLVPALIGVAILVGLMRCRGHARRLVVSWFGLALIWQCIATLDLPWLSLARVQAPAVALGCLGAAVAVDNWLVAGPAARYRTLAAAWLLCGLVTVPALSRTTIADDDHALLTAALAILQPGDALAYRSRNDPPDERLHLHFPATAVPAGSRAIAMGDVGRASLHKDAKGQGRVFVLLGTRCFMRRCDRPDLHPACARIRRKFKLRVVSERTVHASSDALPWPFERAAQPHAQGLQAELDFPWCIRRGPFVVGVYEVISGRAGMSTTTPIDETTHTKDEQR